MAIRKGCYCKVPCLETKKKAAFGRPLFSMGGEEWIKSSGSSLYNGRVCRLNGPEALGLLFRRGLLLRQPCHIVGAIPGDLEHLDLALEP